MNRDTSRSENAVRKVDSQHVILVHQPHEEHGRFISLNMLFVSALKSWRFFLITLCICMIPMVVAVYKGQNMRRYSELVSIPTVFHLAPNQVEKASLFSVDQLISEFNLKFLSQWEASKVPLASGSFVLTNVITKATVSTPQQLTPVGTLQLMLDASKGDKDQVKALFAMTIKALQGIAAQKVSEWKGGMHTSIANQQQVISAIESNIHGLQQGMGVKVTVLSEPKILMLTNLQNNLDKEKAALSAQKTLLSTLNDKVSVLVPLTYLSSKNTERDMLLLLLGFVLASVITIARSVILSDALGDE